MPASRAPVAGSAAGLPWGRIILFSGNPMMGCHPSHSSWELRGRGSPCWSEAVKCPSGCADSSQSARMRTGWWGCRGVPHRPHSGTGLAGSLQGQSPASPFPASPDWLRERGRPGSQEDIARNRGAAGGEGKWGTEGASCGPSSRCGRAPDASSQRASGQPEDKGSAVDYRPVLKASPSCTTIEQPCCIGAPQASQCIVKFQPQNLREYQQHDDT